MFIFDAHLDLAMNAIEWNRDLTKPIDEIRAREYGLVDRPDRGRGTVSLPELRRGNVGLVVATQIARYAKPAHPLDGWRSPAQARAMTQGQLAWYRAMEEAGEMVSIRNRAQLDAHLAVWNDASGVVATATADSMKKPIGYILSLEGADSIVTLGHLERSYEQGLRAVGPAHYGPGTYAFGTDSDGGIGAKGRELLKEMDRLGLILDATHLCDTSFREALDLFQGPVWASHSNPRALTPHNRQFSDVQLQELFRRGAVIGAPLDAWMMIPGWVRGQTTPQATKLTLEKMAEHIDYVCQLAGSALHSGIGTDLDGGFGREQCPMDLDTIADLQQVPELLRGRGYKAADVESICHGNFLRFLRNAWK
ncbi:MAG: rane dipeptidase [Verrucomicrobiota bacterium]|jgi:membrane dipeptidase